MVLGLVVEGFEFFVDASVAGAGALAHFGFYSDLLLGLLLYYCCTITPVQYLSLLIISYIQL